ncbi:MAG: hypothetical protein MJZ19_10360 [Paludibacteraceae bacterium]|nr:hypothetical protein [Paludibacteraceae bacterium]
MDQNTKSELDLVVICAAIIDWLKGMYRSIVHFFVVLVRLAWKKKFIMAVSAILGIIAGYSFVAYENYEYKIEAEAQLRTNTTDAVTVFEVLTSLDNQCISKRYDQLALALNIPEDSAEMIKRIEPLYWIDSRHDGYATCVDKTKSYLKDTSVVRMNDRLQIKVTTSDLSMLPKLSLILRDYISRNERIKHRHELKLASDKMFADKYSQEVLMLDSLRNIEYFGAMSSQNKVQIDGPMIVSNKDKQLYHEQIMTLQGYKQDFINSMIRNAYCVEFVNEFVMTKLSPRWLKVPLVGAFAFMFIALIGCYISLRKRRIKAFLEKEE